MKTHRPAGGTRDAVYQVRLPVPKRTIELVASLIRGRRKQLGTRRRRGTPGTQAIVVLAVLRHDQRLVDMAGGNAVSASTVRRWILEVLGLLAARAPRLDRALKKTARRGGVVVLLDGTLVRTRRRTGADNRRNHSGKHKAHGLLFLALTDEKGNLIWISSARPGRAGEIAAARHDHITRHLREAGLGFVGLDDDPNDAPVIITGRKATRSHRPPRRTGKLQDPRQSRAQPMLANVSSAMAQRPRSWSPRAPTATPDAAPVVSRRRANLYTESVTAATKKSRITERGISTSMEGLQLDGKSAPG